MQKKRNILIAIICLFTVAIAIAAYAATQDAEDASGTETSGISSENIENGELTRVWVVGDVEDALANFLYRFMLEAVRQPMIDGGELPEDTPRITIEQATEIVTDPTLEQEIVKADFQSLPLEIQEELERDFDAIAGAPDYRAFPAAGGQHNVYGLNDKCTEFISLHVDSGSAYYYKLGVNDRGEAGVAESYYLSELWTDHQKEVSEMVKQQLAQQNAAEKPSILNGYYTKLEGSAIQTLDAYSKRSQLEDTPNGYYMKEILQEAGEISDYAPMLTLERVKDICADTELIELRAEGYGDYEDKQVDFHNALLSELNAIAGAPDVISEYLADGRCVYFLNDAETEYILVLSLEVYHVSYNADGSRRADEALFPLPYSESTE